MLETIGKVLGVVAACLVGALAVMVVAIQVAVQKDESDRGWK